MNEDNNTPNRFPATRDHWEFICTIVVFVVVVLAILANYYWGEVLGE
jgi:hypothetical protein